MMTGEQTLRFFKSKALSNAYKHVSQKTKELTAQQIEEMVNITSTDKRIKKRFWLQISDSLESGDKIRLKSIYTGICSYTNLYKNIISNPTKLAWLFIPPSDVANKFKNTKENAVKGLLELASLPVVNDRGVVNAKAADRLLRVIELLISIK